MLEAQAGYLGVSGPQGWGHPPTSQLCSPHLNPQGCAKTPGGRGRAGLALGSVGMCGNTLSWGTLYSGSLGTCGQGSGLGPGRHKSSVRPLPGLLCGQLCRAGSPRPPAADLSVHLQQVQAALQLLPSLRQGWAGCTQAPQVPRHPVTCRWRMPL